MLNLGLGTNSLLQQLWSAQKTPQTLGYIGDTANL